MFHVTVVLDAHECSLEKRRSTIQSNRLQYHSPKTFMNFMNVTLIVFYNTKYSILSPLQSLIEPNQTRPTTTGPVWARDWRDVNTPEFLMIKS